MSGSDDASESVESAVKELLDSLTATATPQPAESAAEPIPTELVEEALAEAVRELQGKRREGQVEMCLSVARSFEAGSHLLVQAGTGTGKSLGYLIPALLRASLRDERVVISTATLALQNQLITKDIPLAVRAVAKVTCQEPVKATLLKGWSNYLCRRKLVGSYPDEDTLFEGTQFGATTKLEKEVARIRSWAADSIRGDRDELKPGVSDRAWGMFSVSSDMCLGRTCPMRENCFPVKARTRASSAKVIVTNHSMVGVQAAGLSEVLGSYDLMIIDEAHELPERVRSQASMQITEVTLDRLSRRLRKAKNLFSESRDQEVFVDTCADLDDDINAFVETLDQANEGRFRNGLPTEFQVPLNNLDRDLRKLMRLVKDCAEGNNDDDEQAQITLLKNSLDSLQATVQMLITADGINQVLWVTQPETERQKPKLHCAPLEVAEDIGANLFDCCSAVVTSATLRVGDSFDNMAGRLGLAGLAEVDWKGIDVGSPFRYEKQGILYIPNDLPVPGRGVSEEALERICALAKASQGGLLGLFTSRWAVTRAAEYLRENLDFPILVQGEEQLPNLIEEFRGDPHSCLLGTASLWQGVDVPGLNCRLVTIDRIPFSRPDDPVAQARCDAAERKNRSGFFEVSVPDASLKLSQGVGRLLRTDADKGVVAILDNRIITKGYGKVLRDSLPRFWFTASLAQVETSLGNLAKLVTGQGKQGEPDSEKASEKGTAKASEKGKERVGAKKPESTKPESTKPESTKPESKKPARKTTRKTGKETEKKTGKQAGNKTGKSTRKSPPKKK